MDATGKAPIAHTGPFIFCNRPQTELEEPNHPHAAAAPAAVVAAAALAVAAAAPAVVVAGGAQAVAPADSPSRLL